jgi:hypothetical protein
VLNHFFNRFSRYGLCGKPVQLSQPRQNSPVAPWTTILSVNAFTWGTRAEHTDNRSNHTTSTNSLLPTDSVS